MVSQVAGCSPQNDVVMSMHAFSDLEHFMLYVYVTSWFGAVCHCDGQSDIKSRLLCSGLWRWHGDMCTMVQQHIDASVSPET